MEKDEKIVGTGITFDDVLLLPRYSEVTPDMVSLKTRLSKHITLNIPLVSAAMDTVTESQMAIALARAGGIGIIHKNMTIERQAEEVDRVKRSENGVIKNPITVTKEKKLDEVLALMAKYHISGIPVVDENKILIGIITNRDLKFETNLQKKVEEVMSKMPLVTGEEGTSITEAEKILAASKKEKLPLVDKQGRLCGLITVKDIEKIKQYPQAAKDQYGRLLCGAGVGITPDLLTRAKALIAAGVDVLALDSAHGINDDDSGLRYWRRLVNSLWLYCGERRQDADQRKDRLRRDEEYLRGIRHLGEWHWWIGLRFR